MERNKVFWSFVAAVVLLCSLSSAMDTLTMKDGTKHTGILVGVAARTITFKEGRTLHHYPRSAIQSLEFSPATVATSEASSSSRELAGSRKAVTLPAATELTVLTNQEIDSSTATPGQTFPADVAENVTNNAGQVVIPKGSEAQLVIRKVSSGGVTASPEIALDLQSVKVAGHRYAVNTQELEEKASGGLGANRKTAEMVGGGAALGTLIGAIAGHGKGAAIGAAAGAAAGAGTQILTRGKTVRVPAETTLRFKLDQPLRLEAAY